MAEAMAMAMAMAMANSRLVLPFQVFRRRRVVGGG